MNNLITLARTFSGISLYAENVPDARQEFLSTVSRLALIPDDVAEREKLHTSALHMAASLYGSPMGIDKPFAQVGATAIIPISGLLLNRFSGSYGFVTGYNAIRTQLNAALGDDSVQNIVFDVNSPGGMAQGCMELAADIRAARDQKPVLAVVDGLCCSAAYALASQATKIAAAPSAIIGSIGAYQMHVSVEGALKNDGIEVTFIKAGEFKAAGNPFENLSPEVKKDMQARIDATYNEFLAVVEAGRGSKFTAKDARKTEARVYDGADAFALGLVDEVSIPQAAVSAFTRKEQSGQMTVQTPQTEGAAPDASAIQAAERARVAGILGHAEAAGRSKLAQHLATKTSMSVEDAGAMLAVAEKETVSAAPVKQTDALADAMSKTEQPDVGADGSGGDGKPDRVAAALASWAAMTGNKPLAKN
jgi:signal peptide peptidase SppA